MWIILIVGIAVIVAAIVSKLLGYERFVVLCWWVKHAQENGIKRVDKVKLPLCKDHEAGVFCYSF